MSSRKRHFLAGALLAFFLVGSSLVAAAWLPANQGAVEPQLFLPFVATSNDPDQPIPFGPVHSGEGTYYAATGAGNCLFPPTPNDLMVAAMNDADYGMADFCGAYIRVSGPLGSVIVRVVDRCPECAPGDVDLSREAFGEIAEIPAGRVPITWQLVSYPVAGPIAYHFKDGSNQWWTAVQIRNHRNPVATVEVLNGQGLFEQVPRLQYNYFVDANGMGPGPYTFRVTDILGNVLVDSGIPHVENGTVSGTGQFPPP